MKIYTKIAQIERLLDLDCQQIYHAKLVEKVYSFKCTAYYLNLVKNSDFTDPIFSQIFPQRFELSCFGEEDPFKEEGSFEIPHVYKRYKNRILIVTTNLCFVHCRFCTRKRNWKGKVFFFSHIDELIELLRFHEEIEDVILSGGDPFCLPIDLLEEIISKLKSVKHIKVIRIGSRAPVVAPDSVDSKRLRILKKYAPLWLNTHFNHYIEITEESKRAILNLMKAGISINNQTVLLKGINDDYGVLRRLFVQLASIGVRPYYLFNCDPVKGVLHFRVGEDIGKLLIERLLDNLSPMYVPRFAVDTENGKKIVI